MVAAARERGEGARGEARSTVGGTKSRKIQVAP